MSLPVPKFQVDAFSYQSHSIVFSEWANLFTLCLAPLIAHVLGGVPKAVYLWHKSPRWHDRLWQFNPTSILWRYFIITDRRIRAKSWNINDMAASNAYFWTAQGWDGSVAMMEKSRPYALRLPAHHHIRLVSGSAVTSLIVTIQGVMAIKTLIDGTSDTNAGSFSTTINISSIFYPLAFFGLLRLFAALWLTDDYLYYGDIENLRNSPSSSSYATALKEPNVEVGRQTTMSLLESEDTLSSDRFHPTNSWRGILFRLVYLVPICCLVAICLVYLVPRKGTGDEFSLTTLLVVLFYTIFLVVTLFLYGFYFLAGRTTNSIIPCATSMWYKSYTSMLMTLILVLVIIACLETRITPCGLYTTYPNTPFYDVSICGGLPMGTGALAPEFPGFNFSSVQAYAAVENGAANFTSPDMSLMKTVAFTFQGFCLGHLTSNGAVVESVVPLVDSIVI